jgi:hypothetical protein
LAGAGWLWTLVRERDWRNRWLGSLIVTAATTVFVQLVSMAVVQADTAGVISHGQTTIFGILRTFVHYLKIVTQEAVTYMWHNDRVLLGILVAAGIGMAVRFTSDAAAVFFGGVCATYVITAGVGFSSFMRYEMILFPAAAVAAGAMLQLLLGEPDSRSDSDSGADPETVESTPGTRPDRWKPQLAFNIAALAVVLGVSLPGSWSSAAAAPPSPSYAAAQGGRPYALPPLAKPGAEVTLNAVFNQTFGMAAGSGVIQGALDWVHVVRYRPTAPDQPGWSTRAKDGTTLIHPNSMDQDPDAQKAFGRALSLNRTVRSDTVKILSRQVSEYGEDVVFTVLDNSGTVHRGTATTLYPVWDKRDPGVITALVFDN